MNNFRIIANLKYFIIQKKEFRGIWRKKEVWKTVPLWAGYAVTPSGSPPKLFGTKELAQKWIDMRCAETNYDLFDMAE